MDSLSRHEFAQVLRNEGYRGEPRRFNPDAVLPADTEELLAEMTFTAQYEAVRKLYEWIDGQGQSPAAMGALVRAYANLGLLTEFHWNCADKAFKARALLYAQRLLSQRPGAWAYWHRAYALALTGLHQTALADLQAAAKAGAGVPAAAPPPAWTRLIRPYCCFELEGLDPAQVEPPAKDLARLLRFHAVALAGDDNQIVTLGLETIEKLPECYGVHDALCKAGGLGVRHGATQGWPATVAETLYARLDALPDLPAAAKAIVKRQLAGAASPGAVPPGAPRRVCGPGPAFHRLAALRKASGR